MHVFILFNDTIDDLSDFCGVFATLEAVLLYVNAQHGQQEYKMKQVETNYFILHIRGEKYSIRKHLVVGLLPYTLTKSV